MCERFQPDLAAGVVMARLHLGDSRRRGLCRANTNLATMVSNTSSLKLPVTVKPIQIILYQYWHLCTFCSARNEFQEVCDQYTGTTLKYFTGVNLVTAGQVIKLGIGYNGNHQDSVKNFFNLRYVCGEGVNHPKNFEKIGPVGKDVINCKSPCTQMTVTEIISVDGQPATVDTYPIQSIKSSRQGWVAFEASESGRVSLSCLGFRHTISFKMPSVAVSKMTDTASHNKCTFALVEGQFDNMFAHIPR